MKAKKHTRHKPKKKRGKPTCREWCGKCPVYNKEIANTLTGCCLSNPSELNYCPKASEGKCCFQKKVIPVTTVCGTSRPKINFNQIFPPPRSISSWMCPNCHVHTSTTTLVSLQSWVKRKCDTCNRVYAGTAFIEEREK